MNYKNGTYLSAIESVMKPVDEFSRAQGAIESAMKPALDWQNELSRAQGAIESAMKPTLDWQKQLNLLKATQAGLGFPNIIRGELAVDPFRISTPAQRRTPLFDLPLTSRTGEVYKEISPEIIPAPSPELVPITNHKPVFIVHGHDHTARDTVADFVGNWGANGCVSSTKETLNYLQTLKV